MKTYFETTINAPVAKVWQVLAEDFENAAVWLSQVPTSYAHTKGEKVEHAPCNGRVCELTSKKDGPYAEENITLFDKQNFKLGIEVKIHNTNMPVEVNNALAQLVPQGNTTLVKWSNDTSLKFTGKLLSPLIRMGFSKNFKEILEELKYFCENDQPHPRKLEKLKKAA